ncbi:MAG: rod shape-determining protein RodA [Ruminococcaceae bacterium]|nr:rod shape-determining protein RodA [Oscillospiraceae bacterium]
MKKVSAFFGRFFHGSNKLLIVLCTLCSTYGLLLVYSSGVASGFSSQLAASVGGMFAALLISQADYRSICRFWPVFAVPALILMLLTFTPLGYNVAGTDDTAWLGLPFGSDAPFITFQPSELLKIVFIITFSKHLEYAKDSIHRFPAVLLLCAHAALPSILVFLQGDDGTALVFLCIFAVMMFAAGVHWGYFAAVAGAAVPSAFVLWQVLDEQKRGRIMALIHPEEYLETFGWQQNHALISMGNGGLWGTGYLKGGAVSLYARNNDFIFTEAAEEFGLMGSLLLLILLLGVIFALLLSALRARDELGRSLCIGMMGLIAFQSIINLGMNLRLLPVIGITLPFFSAGGSSVLTLYLGIGLVLSVSFQSKLSSKNNIFTRFR